MNIKLMKTLCTPDQYELLSAMNTFLAEGGKYTPELSDQWLYAQGTDPVLLMAHADTVAEIDHTPREVIMYDAELDMIHNLGGKCLDDRMGVYGIIELVSRGLRPSILITTNEEIGGLGAADFVKSKAKEDLDFFKCIIALDRHGEDDCVFYNCGNAAFQKLIQTYGFTLERGSFTDGVLVGEALDTAFVNLSIGYDNEHSEYEYGIMQWMENTINKVEKIIKDSSKFKNYTYDATCVRRPVEPLTGIQCACCGTMTDIKELVSVDTGYPGETVLICDSCYNRIMA